MYSVSGNVITLTRGDTFNATISIIDAQGSPYTPDAEDVIRFAVKRTAYDRDPLINKTIDHETMMLTLVPSDTKSLDFGTYIFDVEITFADGSVDTFISGKMNLTVEVH